MKYTVYIYNTLKVNPWVYESVYLTSSYLSIWERGRDRHKKRNLQPANISASSNKKMMWWCKFNSNDNDNDDLKNNYKQLISHNVVAGQGSSISTVIIIISGAEREREAYRHFYLYSSLHSWLLLVKVVTIEYCYAFIISIFELTKLILYVMFSKCFNQLL
jgi:hypothetical protein